MRKSSIFKNIIHVLSFVLVFRLPLNNITKINVMLIPNFKAYTELVKDQTKKYISKIEKETDEKGLKIYEKLGTELEFDKLVDLDKKIQEKYIELDKAIQSTPEIQDLATELKRLLDEADVISTVVAPNLYFSTVKIGKDNVKNEIARAVFKVFDTKTNEPVKLELRKTIKRGDKVIETKSDTDIKKEFIKVVREKLKSTTM
jgi:hypothetical protein